MNNNYSGRINNNIVISHILGHFSESCTIGYDLFHMVPPSFSCQGNDSHLTLRKKSKCTYSLVPWSSLRGATLWSSMQAGLTPSEWPGNQRSAQWSTLWSFEALPRMLLMRCMGLSLFTGWYCVCPGQQPSYCDSIPFAELYICVSVGSWIRVSTLVYILSFASFAKLVIHNFH